MNNQAKTMPQKTATKYLIEEVEDSPLKPPHCQTTLRQGTLFSGEEFQVFPVDPFFYNLLIEFYLRELRGGLVLNYECFVDPTRKQKQ